MANIRKVVKPHEIVFTLDATIGQAAFDQAKAFQQEVDIGSCVITKMDGAQGGGGALSAVAASGSPISFIGDGEKFDDFKKFSAEGFVSQLLGMGDIHGLIERFEASAIDEKQLIKSTTKMMEGDFTLRDLKTQLEALSGMGSFSKILEMIPGMQEMLNIRANPDDPTQTVSSQMTYKFAQMDRVLKSMSKPELDSKTVFTEESRIKRIAHGSGIKQEDVTQFMHSFKAMMAMFKKMGKNGGLMQMMKQMTSGAAGGGMPGMPKGMGGMPGMGGMDPAAMMAQMQQMMGGMGGMPRGKGGKMPNMAQMQQMLASGQAKMPKGMGGGGGLGGMMKMLGSMMGGGK
eukprot:gnl/Carplike_NY0171/3180_a4274_469.p1 GENE.gnl/Carplike_NY0171/3180_a4274_469~~gnl/Carplike_NY0171/3180_a4274_469.p1  ORF type:complete len:382 (+),score=144.68 gnl/Carplike_NY0171/3180_a4274_469:117-1148(+)